MVGSIQNGTETALIQEQAPVEKAAQEMPPANSSDIDRLYTERFAKLKETLFEKDAEIIREKRLQAIRDNRKKGGYPVKPPPERKPWQTPPGYKPMDPAMRAALRLANGEDTSSPAQSSE